MRKNHLINSSALSFMEAVEFQTDPVQDFVYEIKCPSVSIDEIILGQSEMDGLRQIISEHKNAHKLSEFVWLVPTNKIFLEWASWCGKTLTAIAIASELGKGIVIVNLNEIISSRLGETSKNLQKVIKFAEKNRYVLFFDEFDSLSRNRGDDKELGEMKRIVNGIIQLLDFWSPENVIIAATNHFDQIDGAIVRRFEKFVSFTKPNSSQIKQYLWMIERGFAGKVKIRKDESTIRKLNGLDFFTIKSLLFVSIKRKVLASENFETVTILGTDLA